jgi:hypothetical protein
MTIDQDYRRGKVMLESLAHEIFAAAHPGWVVAGRTALVGRRRTGADFPRARRN